MDKINLAPARAIIAEFEGLRLKAYICPAGVATIGIGTTTYPDGRKVRLGDTCTVAQANEWVDHFIAKKIFPVLLPAIKADITNNMLCALVSYAYNVGPSGAKKSDIVKALNAGKPKAEVADLFLSHNTAKGKVIAGLVRRRKMERKLFLA